MPMQRQDTCWGIPCAEVQLQSPHSPRCSSSSCPRCNRAPWCYCPVEYMYPPWCRGKRPSSHPYPPLVLISTPHCITGLRSKRASANAGAITVTSTSWKAQPGPFECTHHLQSWVAGLAGCSSSDGTYPPDAPQMCAECAGFPWASQQGRRSCLGEHAEKPPPC